MVARSWIPPSLKGSKKVSLHALAKFGKGNCYSKGLFHYRFDKYLLPSYSGQSIQPGRVKDPDFHLFDEKRYSQLKHRPLQIID
jgi:hypothetical protein